MIRRWHRVVRGWHSLSVPRARAHGAGARAYPIRPASAPVQIDVTGRMNTNVIGINPSGVIVGTYTIGSATHGFIGVPIQEEP